MKFYTLSCILIFFINLITQNIFAQNRYRIIYDIKSDNIETYRLGINGKVKDTLKMMAVLQNSMIEFYIKNINPFAIEVNHEIIQENYEPNKSGFNLETLIKGIPSFTTKKIDQQRQLNESHRIFDDFASISSRFEAIPKEKVRGKEDKNVLDYYKNLIGLFRTIDEFKFTLESNLINPSLSKKEIIEKVIKSLISQDNRLRNKSNNLIQHIFDLKQILEVDTHNILAELSLLKKRIQYRNSERFEKEIDTSIMLLDEDKIDEMLTMLKEASNSKLEEIDALKNLLVSLETAPFEQTIDFLVNADNVIIDIKIIQAQFANKFDETKHQEIVRTRKIVLSVKGGLKINTGIAITLNNFKGRSKDYFKDSESKVREEDNDFFLPNICAMVNFYPLLTKNINIGATFGVSIPITTNNQTLSGINFLLGPTLIFGTKSRVSLSGGLAYGPVKRLNNGLEIGDETTLDESDFTKSIYDLGFFFGISFSLYELSSN
jgi:hypothetical protein